MIYKAAHYFFLLAVLLTAACTQETGTESELTVTSVANEGFLIRAGSTHVLIDAIFTEDWGKYAVPAPDVLEDMRHASGVFAYVDLFLVTHSHADHFHPASVLDFMRNNKKAVLLAPGDSVDMLKSLSGYSEIDTRVRELTPDWGETATETAAGITVTAFRLKHWDDDALEIQNLGFIWNTGDKAFFHAGDAALDDPDEYGQFFDPAGIDMAFVPWWLLDYWESCQILVERVQPRAMYFMHSPLADNVMTQSKISYHADSLPPSYVPGNYMETLTFHSTSKGWEAD